MVPDEIAGVRDAIRGSAPNLVAVDGMNGAGKTTRVARRLGLRIVSTDDFLVGDGRYLAGLRLDDLRTAISAEPSPVVVEGCCILEVLGRIGLIPDLHVYVRRISPTGRWDDEEVGLGDDAEHQLRVLGEIREAAQRFNRRGRISRNELHADLIRYHARYRPFQYADVVVDLPEGS